MSDIIIYLLKAILIQGIFYSVYWFFFRRTAFHSLNRVFLLSALILSFFIPFIELPVVKTVVPDLAQEIPIVDWLSDPVMQTEAVLEPISTDSTFSVMILLPWLYSFTAIILMIRSVFYLSALQRLKKKSESISKRWYNLFKTSQSRPFSFLKNVFIPNSLFGTNAFDQVLAHECVHVRRFHSVDRLFLDFLVSLFWFNPFIYCYRNALIEIHEYEADEGVLKQYDDLVSYQEVLFAQLQSPQYSGLVSHFNFQMIKKRIVMMNKQKKRTGWMYVLTVPVTLLLIFAFSSKDAMKPINVVGNEISSFIGPIGTIQEHAYNGFQDNNQPSILPLRKSDMVRMTSGFGMRMHPVEKVRKMHLGMDFSCKVGSEVIATADGEVFMISNKPDGYGKLIVVDHGNGFKTYYAQLSQTKVKQGDMVNKGQVIALSGSSGMSTAPHLHYEVMKDNKRVDPARYITDYRFTQKELNPPLPKKEEKTKEATKSQELIEKEHELARREAELAAREMELVIAKEEIAQEEMERAEEAQMKARELEMEARQEALEQLEEAKLQEELAREEAKLSMIKVNGTKGDDPLYVLDGEIIETEMGAEIDQSAIESINVIKGEKEEKKYGKRGENGVIEIKSKSPKDKQKIKVKDKKKEKVKDKKSDK